MGCYKDTDDDRAMGDGVVETADSPMTRLICLDMCVDGVRLVLNSRLHRKRNNKQETRLSARFIPASENILKLWLSQLKCLSS